MAASATRRKSTTGIDLSHLVPPKMFADEYVARKVDGIWDVDLLRYAKAAMNNTLFKGPTGPGKTSLILAYCAKDKIPLVTIQCNGAVDPNTFWGMPVLRDGTLDYQYSEVTEVIIHGGCLYLDEVNFLHPKVAAVFHGLLDKRRQITIPEMGNKVIKAHEDLQVVVAYNPDYEGTKPLNAAFANRFKIKVHMDYDKNVEKELVCIPALLDVAEKLRHAHKKGDVDTPVSTNMLIEFEELAVDLGFEFALSNFLNAFSDEDRGGVAEAFEMYTDTIRQGVADMEKAAS